MSSDADNPSEPSDVADLVSHKENKERNNDDDLPVWPEMLVRSEAEELLSEDDLDEDEKKKKT
jgi:hypothetical protein